MLSEARILLDVRPHAGLPLVREDFYVGARYYLVMDWVEGKSLPAGARGAGRPRPRLRRRDRVPPPGGGRPRPPPRPRTRRWSTATSSRRTSSSPPRPGRPRRLRGGGEPGRGPPHRHGHPGLRGSRAGVATPGRPRRPTCTAWPPPPTPCSPGSTPDRRRPRRGPAAPRRRRTARPGGGAGPAAAPCRPIRSAARRRPASWSPSSKGPHPAPGPSGHPDLPGGRGPSGGPARTLRAAEATIERHGGVVAGGPGPTVLGVFARASDAIGCALALLDDGSTIWATPGPIHPSAPSLRMALHTGEAERDQRRVPGRGRRAGRWPCARWPPTARSSCPR